MAFEKSLVSPGVLAKICSADAVEREQDVGYNEAECKDLCWRQPALKQHLREDEGAAPDGHHNKCYKVEEESIV